MASRQGMFRCANLARVAISRAARRHVATEGILLNPQKRLRSGLLENANLVKARTFSAAVAVQNFSASPLGLVSNVDVKNLAGIVPGSLSEASPEDDDEQNCPAASDVVSKVQDEATRSETSGQVFAVVHIGGRQFKITVNDTIIINRIDAETGDKIRLEKVLLVGGENFSVIGRPLVERDLACIEATVMEKRKTPKVLVFKKKRRKGYKRMRGHRQDITVLKVNSIHLNTSVLSDQANS